MSINIEEPAQLLPSLCPCSPAALSSSSPHPAQAPSGVLELPRHRRLWGASAPGAQWSQTLPTSSLLAAGQSGTLQRLCWCHPQHPSWKWVFPAKPRAREPPGCPWHWDLAGQGAVCLAPLQPPALVQPPQSTTEHRLHGQHVPKATSCGWSWQRWLAWAAVCDGTAFKEAPGQISHSPGSTERQGLFRTQVPMVWGPHTAGQGACSVLCRGFMAKVLLGTFPHLG